MRGVIIGAEIDNLISIFLVLIEQERKVIYMLKVSEETKEVDKNMEGRMETKNEVNINNIENKHKNIDMPKTLD